MAFVNGANDEGGITHGGRKRREGAVEFSEQKKRGGGGGRRVGREGPCKHVVQSTLDKR